MTNNFSTIKARAASEKIILIRMMPGRSVLNDLTLIGDGVDPAFGFTYTMTWPYATVAKLEVNGIQKTLTSGVPTTTQYSFNTTTRLLTINLGALLSLFQAVGNIVVFHYLFFTNSRVRITTLDPEDNTTASVDWEPRIHDFPDVENSQNDIIDSVLTIGNTSVTISNEDSFFQQYLGPNDSFSRKEVKMWQCLDSTDNYQKFFSGYIIGLTIDRNVTFELDNLFSILNSTLFSNTTYAASVFTGGIGNYPSVHPNDDSTPIYKIYSFCSKMEDVKFESPRRPGYTYQTAWSAYYKGFRAINTNYNATKSTTNNRIWSACFASTATSAHTETAAGVSNLGALYTALNAYRVDVADTTKYRLDDQVSINGAGGWAVIEVDSGNSRIVIQDYGGGAIANGNTIVRPAISIVQIENTKDDGIVEWASLQYILDYDISTDVYGVYKITLVNNFEASFLGSSFVTAGIDPNTKMLYRAYNHDALDHGTIFQKIIEAMGLTADPAAVTAANLTSIKTNFSIPYFDQNSFQEAREVLQDLCSSTFAYLTVNNSFQVGYALFNSISPTDTIGEDQFMKGSFSTEISYRDIYTSFKFRNVHGERIYSGPLTTSTKQITTYEASITNDQARFLHGVGDELEINYITQTMTNSSTRIRKILTNRRATVSFSSKGVNFSSIIGDLVTVQTEKAIGSTGEIKLQILSIIRSPDKTVLKGLDLLGL